MNKINDFKMMAFLGACKDTALSAATLTPMLNTSPKENRNLSQRYNALQDFMKTQALGLEHKTCKSACLSLFKYCVVNELHLTLAELERDLAIKIRPYITTYTKPSNATQLKIREVISALISDSAMQVYGMDDQDVENLLIDHARIEHNSLKCKNTYILPDPKPMLNISRGTIPMPLKPVNPDVYALGAEIHDLQRHIEDLEDQLKSAGPELQRLKESFRKLALKKFIHLDGKRIVAGLEPDGRREGAIYSPPVNFSVSSWAEKDLDHYLEFEVIDQDHIKIFKKEKSIRVNIEFNQYLGGSLTGWFEERILEYQEKNIFKLNFPLTTKDVKSIKFLNYINLKKPEGEGLPPD